MCNTQTLCFRGLGEEETAYIVSRITLDSWPPMKTAKNILFTIRVAQFGTWIIKYNMCIINLIQALIITVCDSVDTNEY